MRTPAEHQELARIVLNARITQREQALLLDALYDLEVIEESNGKEQRAVILLVGILMVMAAAAGFLTGYMVGMGL